MKQVAIEDLHIIKMAVATAKKINKKIGILAIDPGVNGYICIYRNRYDFHFVRIPYYEEIIMQGKKKRRRNHIDVKRTIIEIQPATFNKEYFYIGIVEDSIPMPKQNILTTKSMVESSVVPYTIMLSLSIPCMRVLPKDWKDEIITKYLSKEKRKALREAEQNKLESVLVCKEIFGEDKRLYSNGKIQHDKADSLLIAHYLEGLLNE